jgi:hypothetical protein
MLYPKDNSEAPEGLQPYCHVRNYVISKREASTAKWLRTALFWIFWVITQRVVVIFLPTFRDNISVTSLVGGWDQDVIPKRR